jgi:hypothetical protein
MPMDLSGMMPWIVAAGLAVLALALVHLATVGFGVVVLAWNLTWPSLPAHGVAWLMGPLLVLSGALLLCWTLLKVTRGPPGPCVLMSGLWALFLLGLGGALMIAPFGRRL